MDKLQIETKLRDILVEQLGVVAEDVRPETRLVPEHDNRGRRVASIHLDLGADSLDVVELVMTVEEAFGIDIPDTEAEALNDGTVKDLVDTVERQLAA
jgi:acyl carrier protein